MEEDWESDRGEDSPIVSQDHIGEVVSMWTGIPVTRLTSSETERLINMEEVISEQVFGQDEAVTSVSKAVRRARSGMKNPKRPVGAFMFLGPTGVGKTYLVQKLAEFLFGTEDAVVRVDMSEFMERHAVARLVGSPPGYVGYDDGGQLTEAVRRKSYSVILLDEIEKAHPEVFNILLQIFDDGHLTDAKGRKVDFRNTIIVMTSNIGSDLIRQDKGIGFSMAVGDSEESEHRYNRMKQNVMDEVKKFFRPEFLNRIDSMLVFKSLAREQMNQIIDLMLMSVSIELVQRGINLEVTEQAKSWIVEKGFDPQFGARPLRRVIQDHVEDKLSDIILSGDLNPGDTAIVDVVESDEGGNLQVTAQSPVPIAST